MEGAPAAPAPASPPPKQRPVGSFPQDHYSPGKLYTQFRIADGKSPLAWRKTNVFQADASPGSGAGADASSPSPLREAAARRLDAAGGALGPDGERTPIRLPQPSYDKLFRANVPASRLLQRLQANRSLPPLMRRRERAFVQRRLLELVQPREPPSEEELAALEAAASTSRELPNDDQLLVLEKRFAKAVAARAAAYASGKGARPSAKGARAGKGGASAGRDGTPSKRKRAVEDEDEEPTPISGGVSKTSGRTLYIPARLRQPVPDKHAAKRTPVGARAGPPHGENGAGVVSARKALKTSTAYPRIRASGIKGARALQDAAAYDGPLGESGSPFSPGAGGHLRDRHDVRIGPLFQANLPAELDAVVAGAGAAGADDRGDELLWTPLEWRAGAAPESGADAGGADVDVFLERMGVRELKRPAPLDGAPAGAPSQPLSTGGSANPAGAGTAGSQGSAAAGPPAALVEGDSVCVGGLSQERCLHALLQSKYDAGAAAAALGAEEPALVVWNKPEVRKFNVSLKSHGELMEDLSFEANLRVVQRDVKTKSIAQIVHYFYLTGPKRTHAQSWSQPRIERTASPGPSVRAASPAPSSAGPSVYGNGVE